MAQIVPEFKTAQKIYKVSEITRDIRATLESQFGNVWIEGEVSNFKHHSSGHMYFTLKDETAQISAVFFAKANQFLKFELKDGLHIICIGRISVYDQRGQYQIYVQRIEPKGLGALQLAFLQLKERLEKEGLFAPERKREIPLYPTRIGLVTSPTGAAIQDMLKIFRRKKFGLEIYFCPVRVQGDGTAEEIRNGIEELNRFGSLDLIIVGRGGGSLEDLWAFNEEIVARAIVESKIPIISAVGHEIDWTIADFVSDFRAHTPTAAAEKIVMHWNELERRLQHSSERMKNSMYNLLQMKQEELINAKDSYAFRQPMVFVNQLSQRVDEMLRQMQNYSKGIVQEKKQNLRNLSGKLNALSPLAILERGYSITFDEQGELLRELRQVRVGQTIQTRLKSGILKSKITEAGA